MSGVACGSGELVEMTSDLSGSSWAVHATSTKGATQVRVGSEFPLSALAPGIAKVLDPSGATTTTRVSDYFGVTRYSSSPLSPDLTRYEYGTEDDEGVAALADAIELLQKPGPKPKPGSDPKPPGKCVIQKGTNCSSNSYLCDPLLGDKGNFTSNTCAGCGNGKCTTYVRSGGTIEVVIGVDLPWPLGGTMVCTLKCQSVTTIICDCLGKKKIR